MIVSGSGSLVYVEYSDIYVVTNGTIYNVHNKYTDTWLGTIDMAQMSDFRKHMEEATSIGKENK